jgi:hypothetical protein
MIWCEWFICQAAQVSSMRNSRPREGVPFGWSQFR